MNVNSLTTKIFADGADLADILSLVKNPIIKGFTTNPTLMKVAGVADYEQFARQVIEAVPNHPLSFEVFADDIDEMEKQARIIASWGDNINVKIPVTNTKGESTARIIEILSNEGIVLNITAIMTTKQVKVVADALNAETPSIVSVFAGRVADTGVDPIPHMIENLDILKSRPKAELLWASPRELLNIFQANDIGCHIITVTNGLLSKLANVGKDLDQFSLETVEMFYNDAASAGYKIRL
jgi:transaldolase